MNTKSYNFVNILSSVDFEREALQLFRKQASENKIYQAYMAHLAINPASVTQLSQIPFLPIEFFKTQKVFCGNLCPEFYFSSSGTTGQQRSQHFVADLKAYEESFLKGFLHFYGDPRQYCFLALLPSYLENKESSLIHMVRGLMKASGNEDSDFYLNNFADLSNKINLLEESGKKYFLLGVSYALLDFAEQHPIPIQHGIIMETGGMKGRRKEMTREELHTTLCEKFQVSQIHSEYGMTELLSQAYAKSGGRFSCPPWMRVIIRDVNDPFSSAGYNRNGGINVIDLANTDSCAFIETQDLGMLFEDGSFTVNGRFDQSDLRGCNLLIVE